MTKATDRRQDADLADHQQRLERIEQSLPSPDTVTGDAQRVRIHVPTPDSLLTVGARGTGSPDGAEGPAGVSVFTEENLAAEIHGDTILDTDGNTIVHSELQTAVVSKGDASLSSNAEIHVGSEGDIEITAGGAGFADPAFTVRPSVDVPQPPEVDTASPRAATEEAKTAWKGAWLAWDMAAAVRTWASFITSSTTGVQNAALERGVSTVLGLLRATASLGEGIAMGLEGVASGRETPPGGPEGGAKLQVQAAGGVNVTSPGKIGVYSNSAVSVGAPYSASVKGGWKASLKSGGNAKVYGVLSASVATEGLLGMKGRAVITSGDVVESKAKRVAVHASEGKLLLEAKEEAALSGETTAVAGNEVHVGGRDRVEVTAKTGLVDVKGEQRVRVRSPNDVILEGDSSVQLRQGRGSLTLDQDQVEMRAGSTVATLTSSEFSVHGMSVRQGEVRIRGRMIRIG